MTTIEGTIKIVAKTSGIILEEKDKVWYNPVDTELDVGNGEMATLKQLVLEELKAGQYIELNLTGEKTFFSGYKILREVAEQTIKKEQAQVQSIKGLKAKGIMAGDFISMVELVNQFRDNHNVKYSQPYPRISDKENYMIILYYEE